MRQRRTSVTRTPHSGNNISRRRRGGACDPPGAIRSSANARFSFALSHAPRVTNRSVSKMLRNRTDSSPFKNKHLSAHARVPYLALNATYELLCLPCTKVTCAACCFSPKNRTVVFNAKRVIRVTELRVSRIVPFSCRGAKYVISWNKVSG